MKHLLPRSMREIVLIAGALFLTCILFKAIGVLTLSWEAVLMPPMSLGVFFCMSLTAAYTMGDSGHTGKFGGAFMDVLKFYHLLPPEKGLDPWEMQRDLMVMSDQRIARRAQLTETSLLYGALILEEAGETLTGLARAALRASNFYEPETTEGKLCSSMFANYNAIADAMDFAAGAARYELKKLKDMGLLLTFDLTRAEAQEIFDGTVDLTVVNCGFALASGLPGAEGYVEATASNISKKNPETGMIDKDPSGKWIKGPNYFEPDLLSILVESGAVV